MYITLGETLLEKIVFVIINTSLEAFKVYNVILASTYLYFYRIGHSIYSKKELIAKATLRYSLYTVVALSSIFASLGFTVAVVDRMNSRSSSATDFTAQKADKESMVSLYEQQVKDNLGLIEIQKGIIQDTQNVGEAYITRKQAIINNANTSIAETSSSVAELRGKIAVLKTEISELNIKQREARVEFKRTMFDILSESTNIPSSTLILTLLLVVSILIEIGAVTTSPHSIYLDDPLSKDSDKISSFEEEEEELIKDRRPYRKRKESYWMQKKKRALAEKKEEPILEVEQPQQEAIVEDVPVRTVVHPKKSLEQRFVEELFNNGAHPYLKDRHEVAEVLKLNEATTERIFSYLNSTEGPNGYKLIEFRRETGKWYPSYTSEVIHHLLEGKSVA